MSILFIECTVLSEILMTKYFLAVELCTMLSPLCGLGGLSCDDSSTTANGFDWVYTLSGVESFSCSHSSAHLESRKTKI
jgi:hypothetical protein